MTATWWVSLSVIVTTSLSLGVLISRRGDEMGQEANEWFTADILPVSLTSQQAGDSLELVFEVRHSTSGQVYNALSLEQPGQTGLKQLQFGATNTAPVVSQVVFNIPNGWCETNDYYDARFDFENPDGALSSVEVEVCHFRDGQSNSGKDNRVSTNNGDLDHQAVRHSTIKFPQFKIAPPGNTVTILPNANTTFDTEFRMTRQTWVVITAVFYHSEKDALLVNDIFIDLHHENNQLLIESKGSGMTNGVAHEDIITVQEVANDENEANLLSNDDNGIHPSDNAGIQNVAVTKKLQVSLNTASQPVSGILFIHSLQSFTYSVDVHAGGVTASSLTLPVVVKKSNQVNPLPPGKYLFRNYGPFVCTEAGTLRWRNMKTCHTMCFVTGMDIASIIIYRRGEHTNSPASKSMFEYYTAEAVLDLGPTHKALEGDYVCEVSGQNGETAQHIIKVIVATPPMILNKSSVSDLGSGVTQIACSASGDPMPDIRIYVDDLRLDDKSEYTKEETASSDFEKTVTLRVPTDQVRWPRYEIRCKAYNEGGHDFKTFLISEYINSDPTTAPY